MVHTMVIHVVHVSVRHTRAGHYRLDLLKLYNWDPSVLSHVRLSLTWTITTGRFRSSLDVQAPCFAVNESLSPLFCSSTSFNAARAGFRIYFAGRHLSTAYSTCRWHSIDISVGQNLAFSIRQNQPLPRTVLIISSTRHAVVISPFSPLLVSVLPLRWMMQSRQWN